MISSKDTGSAANGGRRRAGARAAATQWWLTDFLSSQPGDTSSAAVFMSALVLPDFGDTVPETVT